MYQPLLKYFLGNGPPVGWDGPQTEKGGSMVDRSINRQYRWKVKGRLAVLDHAAVHGVTQPRRGSGWIERRFAPGGRGRAKRARPVSSLAAPNTGGAGSTMRWSASLPMLGASYRAGHTDLAHAGPSGEGGHRCAYGSSGAPAGVQRAEVGGDGRGRGARGGGVRAEGGSSRLSSEDRRRRTRATSTSESVQSR